MNISNFFKNKKFKHGSLAIALVAVVISLVIIFNALMSVIDKKVKFSVDMTSNKIFSLTDNSKNFIKNLNKDIQIVVLSSENEFINQSGYEKYFQQANEVIKEYARTSNKIKVVYKDVTEDPTYLAQYETENVSKGSIIVKTEDKYKIIAANDLFEIQTASYQAQVTASKAEQILTSAILYVSSEGQAKIALLTGYGEQETSGLENLLSINNYQVDKINLLTSDISSDAIMAVIFAPSKDYDAAGVEKLNKFMENNGKYGKHLLVVSNHEVRSFANLNSVLNTWGVNIEPSVAFETDTSKIISRNMSVFGYVAEYANDAYSSKLKNSSIPFFTPYSNALKIIDNSVAKPMLTLSAKSGSYPLDSKDDNITDKITGNVPVAVVSEKKMNENADVSKIFVFGSYLAFSQNFLSQTSISNSDYIVNMFNSITGQKQIIIEPKSFESTELTISELSSNLLGIVFCVIIPLAILAVGVIIICYRKYRK